MAENRREFLKQAATLGLLAPIGNYATIENYTAAIERMKAVQGDDEKFWEAVQQNFHQSPDFINLENGYFSPQPLPTLSFFIEKSRMINENSSYYMRTRQGDDKEKTRQLLADFCGVSAEETALVRNTTEGLNILIMGLPLKKGDECLMGNYDYPSMLDAFDQLSRRYGTVNKILGEPLWNKTDDEIVAHYEKAITPKTKVLLVTHMINITGQVLPVKRLCDMARKHNVEVLVDGAHTLAHLDFKIPDLGADYFAASLHKWLCCPLGNGLLYVKKDKIANVWPLFGDNDAPADNIRKFEHYGTVNCANYLSIEAAINFHNTIGSSKKEQRLRYLKNYWVDKVKTLPNVQLNTPAENERTCAIANFSIKGMKATETAAKLMEKHKVFTVGIEMDAVNGVRVTPHLYTTEAHLDKLVEGIKGLI